MSYDGSSSAPGSDTRGRVGRSERKGEELEEGAGPGANAPNNNDGGRAPASAAAAVAMPTDRERGSSPGSGSGSSGGDRRGGNRDDTDALSSGNDSGGNHGNGSRRRQSTRSSLSSSHGKDSAMMETSDSNKSSSSPRPSPPSSSLAYSLLSSEGRDPPSTSGCSSAQSARVRTQKQLMTALKELKIRLPAERRGKGHSSTLDALKYALSCVKQVRANQEYYHQWSVEECQGCSLDLSSFTIEELDTITSEYTLKNTDSFSVAVSFLTGKVVYVSPHGASLLRCGARRLTAGVFSELLAPQDVSTFYSGTAPKRLPRWDAGGGGGVSPAADCAQEKSMFCRISAERAHGGEMRYYPFRLTPYQLTLKDSDLADPQPCCLLIGERVHSGYEAPRIPPDKRVFTTSHTPSCLFQEIDERAVPLLGYLPQDLVGTPVLLYLHPEDRPIMVAITKKILQFAGQPFDHSPLRMVARSGEYLTIDTSWSSFVNPWSRKVAFIVGRHKVRTSPLNEDVFTPPRGQESRLSVVPEVVQLSEQIHRVLSAPVHHSAGRHGSQGGSQGSLGSSGSRGSRAGGSSSRRERPHLLRGSGGPTPAPAASSCGESTGRGPAPNEEDAVVAVAAALHKPMSFHQMCSDVQRVKTSGQQVFIESRNRAPPRKTAAAGVGGGLMAVCGDEPIKRPVSDVEAEPKALSPAQLVRKEPPSAFSYQQINCLDSIIRYLDSCNVPNTVKRKCASSSATGSSASDDDKEAATDVVMEEAPPTAAPAPIAPPPPPPPARRGGGGATGVGGACLGLTKEVLSAHTQREEQVFLCRFRDLSQLTVFDSASANASNLARGVRCSRDYPAAVGGASNGRRRCRGAKRLKHQESASPSSSSPPLPLPPLCLLPSDAPPPPLPGPALPLMASAPPPSLSPWPAPLPPAPLPPAVLPLYPLYPPLGAAAPPMMALVLPNFLFPQLAPPPAPLAPPQQFYNPVPYPTPFPPPPLAPAVAMAPPQRGPSRSSTPLSVCGPAEGAESPLFQSRCSSPLNLLQLEEATPTAVMSGQQATPPTQQQGGGAGGKDNDAKDNENSNQDAMSTSSDLLDLLLQEDSRSGTGSAASGSGSLGTGSSGSGSGSGSNGCSSSGSRTRSSQSSHTSKYFGSADDSDQSRHSRRRPAGGSSDEQFIKSVLQDPIWLLMANTDRKVMMTYQLPVRDMEVVLREDREALRNMQKLQPRFTEEQKAELSQVHPWIRTGRLPRTINVNACMGCKSPPAPPFDVETHEMELCGALEASEDKPVAVDAVARGNDQEMTSVDPAAPAKPAAVDAETDMAH